MTADDEGLAGDDAERKILLLSLAQFSLQCEAPQLTPDCPFYEVTGQGPQCAEQCIDLLARHGGVRPEAHVTHLDDGYEIHKRVIRPRRGSAMPGPAFDAGQIQMADADKVTREKRTVALIRELSELLLEPAGWSRDPEDRIYRASANWDELTRRGVPADDLVRLAFAPGLAVIVLLLTTNGGDVPAAPGFDLEGWSQTLAAIDATWSGTGGLESIPVDGFLPTVLQIARHFASADRDSIIHLTPPPGRRLPAPEYPGDDPEPLLVAKWLHDRFSVTYVDGWAPTSRALEWAYLHGKKPGCCPPDVMRERHVREDELANHLADDGVDHLLSDGVSGRDSVAGATTMTTGQFAAVAASHLRDGRYDIAASLFRAILQLEPDDALAHNNLGFCLIPTDPPAALAHLRSADRLSGVFDATTAANTVLALHLAGDDGQALAVAAAAEPQFSEDDPPAWLWQHDCGSPLRLTDGATVASYTAQLRRHIEDVAGRG